MAIKQTTGLILTEGGARAAYQVGVVHAISRMLREAGRARAPHPADIICGALAPAYRAPMPLQPIRLLVRTLLAGPGTTEARNDDVPECFA
jgi:hypothetical protein